MHNIVTAIAQESHPSLVDGKLDEKEKTMATLTGKQRERERDGTQVAAGEGGLGFPSYSLFRPAAADVANTWADLIGQRMNGDWWPKIFTLNCVRARAQGQMKGQHTFTGAVTAIADRCGIEVLFPTHTHKLRRKAACS